MNIYLRLQSARGVRGLEVSPIHLTCCYCLNHASRKTELHFSFPAKEWKKPNKSIQSIKIYSAHKPYIQKSHWFGFLTGRKTFCTKKMSAKLTMDIMSWYILAVCVLYGWLIARSSRYTWIIARTPKIQRKKFNSFANNEMKQRRAEAVVPRRSSFVGTRWPRCCGTLLLSSIGRRARRVKRKEKIAISL